MAAASETTKEDLQAEKASLNTQTTESNLRFESPKKGSTLSTSTSSFEALDPHDPNLSRLANTMFQKTSEYLQEELTATQEDYKLLERMNRETINKYSQLKFTSKEVSNYLNRLNQTYKKLQPVLDNINQIDDSVTKLEQAAYKLLAYSNRLEAKFKDIEKESKK
ncbi:biogenesis of lysosome-related organelles complex 1 subunit 2 [Phymastichus coffea]|uniref:biogenesis of lysosome-related organelles complex 1 subunit 2 n=1 Tax=Phymastichus coffea TaxID=108790 RepID=UPI00273B7786|nr:biogenesis of lysosome-related organelles complex 1 subunit 2 [Phymastichus coffea]